MEGWFFGVFATGVRNVGNRGVVHIDKNKHMCYNGGIDWFRGGELT